MSKDHTPVKYKVTLSVEGDRVSFKDFVVCEVEAPTWTSPRLEVSALPLFPKAIDALQKQFYEYLKGL